jgi:hypothetical protein
MHEQAGGASPSIGPAGRLTNGEPVAIGAATWIRIPRVMSPVCEEGDSTPHGY